MPHSGRSVPVNAVLQVVDSIAHHADYERLHRAVVHYHHALQNWKPGTEIFALAHLYMGMEGLTPVALREHLARENVNREALAARWGIDWTDDTQRRQFDPEIRRRLLFNGDDATYHAAKKASDAYEHSFMPIPSVRALSMEVRDQTAQYLRRAILNLAQVDVAVQECLLGEPYSNVIEWSMHRYVFGTIIGTADDLAAPDQQYPILKWTSKVSELDKPDATFEIQFQDHIAPQLAEGLTFRLDRYEVWGPPAESATASIEVEE
jgi:hypothetical protein